MDEKNVFRLDETILQKRKNTTEDQEIIIDMDGSEVVEIDGDPGDGSHSGKPDPEDMNPSETIHIEIGEMDYDPEDGQWKDSHHGWRVHEQEEKEADYRQIPDHETLEGRALVDKRAGNNSGKRVRQTRQKEKSQKELPLYLQVIYGLVALACLGFCFVYPYYYLSNMIAVASEVPAASEDGAKEVPVGTYCTLKSNSLDGVPVYGNPGDTAQIAFIPEGKYVQLLDSSVVNGKEWAQIDYCQITAWIPMKQLHFINVGGDYIKIGSQIYMNSITEKGIDLYSAPSPQAEVVASGIRYGTEFTVLDLKEGWAQVDHEGTLCWINMFHMGSYGSRHWKVLTLSKAQAINLRKEPSEDAGLYCKVPEHQELEIKEFKDGWGLVDYDGYQGWVMLHYLIPMEGE